MSRRIRLLIAGVLLVQVVLPTRALADVQEYRFTGGIRQDDLRFNIASDMTGTTTPNILSELTWTHVTSLQVGLAYNYYVTDTSKWFYHIALATGAIVQGRVQDSDYLGNNRTQEFSRSYDKTNSGNTVDADLAFGYRIGHYPLYESAGFTAIPIIGYGYRKLDFDINDGNQVVSAYGNTTHLGSFSGLNSSYIPIWQGPFVGLRLQYDNGHYMRFFLNYHHYHTQYRAQGIWNLRSDLNHNPSFEDTSNSDGNTYVLGAAFFITHDSHITVTFEHQQWKVNPGVDTTYFANGTVVSNRYNGAWWTTNEVTARWQSMY